MSFSQPRSSQSTELKNATNADSVHKSHYQERCLRVHSFFEKNSQINPPLIDNELIMHYLNDIYESLEEKSCTKWTTVPTKYSLVNFAPQKIDSTGYVLYSVSSLDKMNPADIKDAKAILLVGTDNDKTAYFIENGNVLFDNEKPLTVSVHIRLFQSETAELSKVQGKLDINPRITHYLIEHSLMELQLKRLRDLNLKYSNSFKQQFGWTDELLKRFNDSLKLGQHREATYMTLSNTETLYQELKEKAKNYFKIKIESSITCAIL